MRAPQLARSKESVSCFFRSLSLRSIRFSHLDVDVKLLDTLQGQFVALDQNAHGLVHELARDLERLRGQRGGEDADLKES